MNTNADVREVSTWVLMYTNEGTPAQAKGTASIGPADRADKLPQPDPRYWGPRHMTRLGAGMK